ncbi:hypothetical protein [Halomonas lysinitropha]|uniref:Prephenate dehydratase n=1 Tax=Halomonas lysinitropha TaxID=2607506 RepID=A0A5K1I4E3_9GAMM|nr:hypothetical protein [Halomonas lysinitropha]VVZ95311.1 hypothetical protein HALO32_01376 [Halomonas lysinitropha]
MRFATLGPEGSNHALVLRRYLERRGPADARVELFEAFPEAFEALLAGRVDRVLQCTAHPSHADCVGSTMHRAFPVEAFVAGSRPLALLARAEVAVPVSVGLQPATRHYTDLSAFDEHHDYATIVEVAAALRRGEVDAGICAREVLAQHPDDLRLVRDLGSALDVWVLYATQPLSEEHPLVLA